MAYTKTEWKDQVVENPRTYSMRDNGDNTVTMLDAFGTVTELGTPVNAVNMNHIEDGIAAVETLANTKQDAITGAASTITGSNLTTNRALTSNGSGKVAVSDTTATELGYVHGVTSNIQTQINSCVKTSGNQTIAGTKTFSSTISGSINGNAATVTNGVYTTGNQTIAGTKTFSSSPVLPTPSNSDSSTKGATTAYVRNLIVPKYNNATNKIKDTQYTAGSNCRIIICGTLKTSGDRTSAEAKVYIDGSVMFDLYGYYVYGTNETPFYVTFDLKQNQTYKIATVDGTLTIKKFIEIPF